MGTQYKLTLACESDQSPEELLNLAIAEMNAVNDSMSTYLESSELSQFNQRKTLEWQTASSALLEVVDIAQMVAKQSDGAFDITVSPLVSLWGFGASKDKQLTLSVPSDEILHAVKEVIGYQKLEIDRTKQRLRKQAVDLQVDLSAVAKGYAVDKVSAVLSAAGCHDHLVDIGGELKLSGSKPDGGLWRIAIEKPNLATVAADNIQQLLDLSSIGVASSGDYRNFYQIEGKRYSHTIDPRTFRPIDHNLAAVTVLHKQTAVADAWATALIVLGNDAPILAEKLELAAYFIFRESTPEVGSIKAKDSKNVKKYRIVATKQFDKFLMSK